MLRTPTLLLSAAFFASAIAQEANEQTFTNAQGQTITVSTAVAFLKSPPMRNWPVVKDEGIRPAAEDHEVRNDRRQHPIVNLDALPKDGDPALQTSPAARLLRAPIVGWNGQSGATPPDPTGAAGPNHYVQAVNTAYRVYSKTGSSMGGPYNLSTLWPGSQNAGDPIVLYDRHADRWFISQFNFSPNRMLLAVSETSDPLGSYYSYSFTLSQFPDYPKFSVWWDGYYMTSNSNKTAIAFDRAKMLVGDASAAMVALTAPGVNDSGFSSVLPADADGDLPPNGTPCYFFVIEDDAWGNPADRIKTFEMTVNWTTPSSSSVLLSNTLNTTPFDTNLGSGFDNISQPGTSQKLDAVSGVLYFRAQHIRWTGYNTMVLSHVVDIGGNKAGVRWYELRDADDGNWTIHQQSTWAPDAAHRWMSSIAMDHQGNIGLAYSWCDPANAGGAGLRYTGRYASDPLDQMSVAESIGMDGTGAQSGTNRYGDYSQMSLDPNGTTFWFTGEYLLAGNKRTRIFSFDLAASMGVQEQNPYYATSALNVINDNGMLNVTVDGLNNDEALLFDVIGVDGKALISLDAQPANKQWNTQVDARGLADGSYFVRIGNVHFQKVERS